MTFTPRLDAPSVDDLHWIKTTHGGYNRCILINEETGQVIPNCTGYAWGRFLEEQGITDCNLSRGNATVWYGNTSDGYNRGQTPRLGAVICYSGGSDNAGHVAIVEEIRNNGAEIVISESTYSGVYFRTKTLLAPFYSWGAGYTLQGFIYPDEDFGYIKKNKFKWILFSKYQKDKRKITFKYKK